MTSWAAFSTKYKSQTTRDSSYLLVTQEKNARTLKIKKIVVCMGIIEGEKGDF